MDIMVYQIGTKVYGNKVAAEMMPTIFAECQVAYLESDADKQERLRLRAEYKELLIGRKDALRKAKTELRIVKKAKEWSAARSVGDMVARLESEVEDLTLAISCLRVPQPIDDIEDIEEVVFAEEADEEEVPF